MVLLYGMMDVQMPANAETFFEVIASIASFDFFSTEEIVNNALQLESKDPYDMRFDEVGFSSGYFLNNLGTQMFAFLLLIFGYILVNCIRRIRWRAAKHVLENMQIWFRNMLIVATIESYVLIVLCSLISLHSLDFGSFGDFVQSSTAIAALLIAILLTVPLLLLYFNWQTLVADARINRQFDIFLRDLPLTKGRHIVLWPLYFIVRRLILSITVVLLNNFIVLQFEIVALNIIVAVILMGSASPFETPFLTKLTLFNEAFTMVLLYHFMCFTQFVQDVPTRIKIGFSFCILEAVNIAVNLLIAFAAVVREAIYKWKLWIAKREMVKQKTQRKLALGVRAIIDKRKLQFIELPESEDYSQPAEPLSQPNLLVQNTKVVLSNANDQQWTMGLTRKGTIEVLEECKDDLCLATMKNIQETQVIPYKGKTATVEDFYEGYQMWQRNRKFKQQVKTSCETIQGLPVMEDFMQ